MVGQMLMVFLIMVSQSMPLLVGGVADASERLVESMPLLVGGVADASERLVESKLLE
jgi:hypothetical protein